MTIIQQKDKDMAQLLKSGNDSERTEAANYLYKRFFNGLVYYFTRNMNSGFDRSVQPHDLAILTLSRAFENISAYEPSNVQFSTWLYRIGINLLIDNARRSKTKAKHLSNFSSLEIVDDEGRELQFQPRSTDYDPLAALVRKERHQAVVNVVESCFSESDMVFIRLRYFDELQYEEISQRLKCPLGTVKGTLNRIKRKFQKLAA
jgi:RNA polymerase sigma-70 factor (ECF subfamily)